MTTAEPRYTLEIEATANGRVGKATVLAVDADGRTVHSDRANLIDDAERRKLVKRMADKLGVEAGPLLEDLERAWNDTLDQRRRFREQAEVGSAEAATLSTMHLLDAAPSTIRRPLCLVNGRAYAAAWVPVRH